MDAEELFRRVCDEFSSFPPPVLLLEVGVEGRGMNPAWKRDPS